MKSDTYRYCTSCREIQKFRFNKNIGHSECLDCGARFAIKDKEKIIGFIIKKYEKMIADADKWLKQQKDLMENIK
jgi:hypothetical protein